MDTLMIDSKITNVEMLPHAEKNVHVVLETFEEGPELEVFVSDEVKKIVVTMPGRRNWFMTTGSKKSHLTIYIPEEFVGFYEIQNSAGNMEIRDLVAERFEVGTGAGNIELNRMKTKRLIVKTGAGNIEGYDCSGELTIHSGAGNVEFHVDGEHDVYVSSGAGNVDIRIENDRALNATVELSAGLGNVHSNLLDTSMKSKKLSQVFGTGENKIKLSTGVGNVSIYGKTL